MDNKRLETCKRLYAKYLSFSQERIQAEIHDPEVENLMDEIDQAWERLTHEESEDLRAWVVMEKALSEGLPTPLSI